MPLIFNNINEEECQILLWHITETEEDLIKFLASTNNYLAFIEPINHSTRRKQKLIAKILLKKLTNSDLDFSYTTDGKPFLPHFPGTISISNSDNYVVLAHHNRYSIGIDIEETSDRIMRVFQKFVNTHEANWVDKLFPLKHYYLIWGVKECVFKAIGGGGILYKEHIQVNKPTIFTEKAGRGSALYTKELPATQMTYYYQYLDDILLVYTIVENSSFNYLAS
jgi:phosphopantetheinyl transferase